MLSRSERNLPELEKDGFAGVLRIKNMFEVGKSRSNEYLKTVSKEMEKFPEVSISMNDSSIHSVSKLKQYFEQVQYATAYSNENDTSAKSNTIPRCRRKSVKLEERKSTVSEIVAGFQTTKTKPPRQSCIETAVSTTTPKNYSLQTEQKCNTVMYENVFNCNCVFEKSQENSKIHVYENVSFCRKENYNYKECLLNSNRDPSSPNTPLHGSEDDVYKEDPIYDSPIISTRVGEISSSQIPVNDIDSDIDDSDGGSGEYEPVGDCSNSKTSFLRQLSNEIDQMFSSILQDNDLETEIEEEDDLYTAVKEKSIQNAIKRHSRCGTLDDIEFNCTGMTCLRNGKIIIANINGELLVFDNECRFLFLEDFPENFQDLTTISDNTIAATCGYTVRFYKIQEGNIQEKEDHVIDFFSSDITVHGISYARDRLVVSCNLQSVGFHLRCFIRIMDTRGKIIGDIKRLQLQKRCLKFPHYVLADSTVDRVYVSDLELKSCMCLTYGGEVLWETRVAGVPQGMAAIDNNIALALEDQGYIAVFSKRGKPVDLIKLKVKEKDKPCLVCYNTVDRSLVVGSQSVDVLSCLHVIKIDTKEEKQLIRSPCKVS